MVTLLAAVDGMVENKWKKTFFSDLVAIDKIKVLSRQNCVKMFNNFIRSQVSKFPGPSSSPLRAVTLNSCAELTYEVKKKIRQTKMIINNI